MISSFETNDNDLDTQKYIMEEVKPYFDMVFEFIKEVKKSQDDDNTTWTTKNFSTQLANIFNIYVEQFNDLYEQAKGNKPGWHHEFFNLKDLSVAISQTIERFEPITSRIDKYILDEKSFGGQLVKSDPGLVNWFRTELGYIGTMSTNLYKINTMANDYHNTSVSGDGSLLGKGMVNMDILKSIIQKIDPSIISETGDLNVSNKDEFLKSLSNLSNVYKNDCLTSIKLSKDEQLKPQLLSTFGDIK
jgi:hypothetical protein